LVLFNLTRIQMKTGWILQRYKQLKALLPGSLHFIWTLTSTNYSIRNPITPTATSDSKAITLNPNSKHEDMSALVISGGGGKCPMAVHVRAKKGLPTCSLSGLPAIQVQWLPLPGLPGVLLLGRCDLGAYARWCKTANNQKPARWPTAASHRAALLPSNDRYIESSRSCLVLVYVVTLGYSAVSKGVATPVHRRVGRCRWFTAVWYLLIVNSH